VLNFDESRFQIRVISGDIVYVPLDYEACYNADPNNQELRIVVASINQGGKKVPAMIIFKGTYHTQGHFKNHLDKNILFTQSDTSFTNKKLRLVFIKHFNKYCPPSCLERF
jgi:hypothetical protein